MKSVVSSKGQITLPAEVREQLGLVPGTAVQFEVRAGAVVIRKGAGTAHPVDQMFGHLRLGQPVDDLIDAMRGPRPRRTKRSRTRAAAKR